MYYSESGDTYEGEWKSGLRNGYGTYTIAPEKGVR